MTETIEFVYVLSANIKINDKSLLSSHFPPFSSLSHLPMPGIHEFCSAEDESNRSEHPRVQILRPSTDELNAILSNI